MSQSALHNLPRAIMRGLVDNKYEGTTIVDGNGNILYISQSTLRFFGLKAEEALGRHVTQVFPDSNLHEVAKTGKAEIGVAVEVDGQKKIVSRIPIMDGSTIVGAISKIMFKDVDAMIHALAGGLRSTGIIDYSPSSHLPQITKFSASYTIVGRSREATAIRDFAQMASRTSSNVLITGETGCGKEVVAKAIHNLSPRKTERFVSVNCSAIAHHLFESEFFGYAPGAFTGAAAKGKDGLFSLAHKGTIFLDEIAELPLEMQPKMLRVLQEKTFYRVGGKRKIDVDFRLICATNKDLEEMVKNKEFRQDLFFRINVLNLRIPPLRERTEDIPDLAYFLLFRLLGKMESNVTGISPEVLKIFQKYAWRGNVREMDNVLERAINVAPGNTIEVDHLPEFLLSSQKDGPSVISTRTDLKRKMEEVERSYIAQALRSAQGNKSAAARILGIHRTHLYSKIRKYGLED